MRISDWSSDVCSSDLIETGAVADLTVFRLDEVQWQREYLVKDVPGGNERLTRPPGGFLYTIVAGRIPPCGGTHSGLLPAQLIERAPAMTATAQGRSGRRCGRQPRPGGRGPRPGIRG